MQLEITTLCNAHVALEPYEPRHRGEVRAAAADPAIWSYMPDDLSTGDFNPWFDGVLTEQAKGKILFFAVRCAATGQVCGSTGYLNIAPAHDRLEIGHTWYAPAAQGTNINPAAKLAMFSHAFACGAQRVELKCDARNARSRAAILKLGAVEEGTLRRHMRISSGFVRDTVYYSVLREEWPKVKAGLEARLASVP